jgi:hypothetical protein
MDGGARLELTITFKGSRAIAWRSALEQVPPAHLYDFVERELIAPSFDGGHVREMTTEAKDVPDEPLVMRLHVDVPEFAKPTPTGLSLHPPFSPHLAQLAALPSRHTPLLRRSTWRTRVRVHVVLPESLKMPAALPRQERREGGTVVVVGDAVRGHTVDFDRVIDLPSGRVEPGAPYTAWQAFVQDADTLLSRDVAIGK